MTLSPDVYSLAGRSAIVTGASRGIGRSIALEFARAGADVGLIARDGAALEAVANEIRDLGQQAHIGTADILDGDSLRATLSDLTSSLGGVQVLVNNAGGNNFTMPVVQARFAGWSKNIRLNLESVVHACQEVIPTMTDQGSGSIINVSSVVALFGAPGMSHYAAAKSAVVSLSKSMALETAHAGIRVNALLPGWIDTDLTDFLRASRATESSVLARVPMARWGRPEEIAAAALFLASDASSFLTGQELVVDGGLSAMP